MENNSDKKVRDIVEDALEANKQVIFTGAPGTGKTYSVRKYVEEMCKDKENGEVDKNQFKFVQFHPSYDYSDFVEGLRPVVVVGQTESTFVRLDGVFKEAPKGTNKLIAAMFSLFIIGLISITLSN